MSIYALIQCLIVEYDMDFIFFTSNFFYLVRAGGAINNYFFFVSPDLMIKIVYFLNKILPVLILYCLIPGYWICHIYFLLILKLCLVVKGPFFCYKVLASFIYLCTVVIEQGVV